ncbi:MAG: hypothetical protein ACE5EI_07245 [Thermodesulfobacteriota bacterium]
MKKWFYNGTFMADGTPISIAATSEAEAARFRGKGYGEIRTRTRRSGPAATAGRRKRRSPLKGKEEKGRE